MNNSHYEKFINFFKSKNLYDENIFRYIRENSLLFDYRDEDYRPFIGTYIAIRNKQLHFLRLIVPYINDDITTLINIHEYSHAIYYIRSKNKYSDLEAELIAITYENLYISENPSSQLTKYQEKLNSYISENNHQYLHALEKAQFLLSYYNENKDKKRIEEKIYKKARKLTKKNKTLQ